MKKESQSKVPSHSSNNMQVCRGNVEQLTDKEQAEVEKLFKVN
jgi:hypothetical protein